MPGIKQPNGLSIFDNIRPEGLFCRGRRVSHSPGTYLRLCRKSLAIPPVLLLNLKKMWENYKSAQLLHRPANSIRKYGHSQLLNRCSHFFTWAQDPHQVQQSLWIHLPFSSHGNVLTPFFCERVLCVIQTTSAVDLNFSFSPRESRYRWQLKK